MGKCSTSLVIRKTQIKSILGIPFTLVRIAIVIITRNVGVDEENGTLIHCS